MKVLFKCFVVSLLALVMSIQLPANGVNLNGNGSKAIAMGGAFIGLADDYSAVFWNPAGLTQMQGLNLSLHGVALIPSGSYSFDLAGIDTETKNKIYLAPTVGFFTPVGEKLVIGLAAYAASGLGAAWDGNDLRGLVPNLAVLEWESYLGVFTISPVIAYKISDQFSIGATLNINYGMLQIHKPGLGQYFEDLSGIGIGFSAGILYKASDSFSIGATVKSPTKVTLSGDAEMAGAAQVGLSTTSEAEREATWPLWFGVGIAWKPMTPLTVTADVQYTNWKKFETIPITYTSEVWEATRMHPLLGGAFDNDFELNWKDAVQIRFGLQYMLSEAFALRAGFYHDPTCAPDDTLNVLLPQFTYEVVTFGFGYKAGNISIDFNLEYLMGAERTSPLTGTIPGTYGMSILVPGLSISIDLNR